jgi:signal transduction histidine kinase
VGTVSFKIDAALLRELGERLVGKPHVALAELIKNAYDADATLVELAIRPDHIEVSDNGHGMDLAAFRDYWMRIGSPHKEKQRTSPGGRSLTGQKGIGRLAVQFLGRHLKLVTKSMSDPKVLVTTVDWDEAVKHDELTSVQLHYDRVAPGQEFPESSESGTILTISRLAQDWTAEELRDLALEIWALQPPFESADNEREFRVVVRDAPPELREVFSLYTQAFRTLWHARIVGTLTPPKHPGGKAHCEVTVSFDDNTKETYVHKIGSCPVRALDFNIAVYSLTGRQPYGISVGELRAYLQNYGGVAIYDTGFRLPFYGVDTDWLRVQLDHSRRIASSTLLPAELNVERGLNFLPTNARILGAVNVNTGEERRWIAEAEGTDERPLEIAISRDRLIENKAFQVVSDVVRASLDFYAMQEAIREFKAADAKRKIDRAGSAVQLVADIVERHADKLPAAALKQIKETVQEASAAVEVEREFSSKQANMLGALASAGIAAAALEHEAARNLKRLELIPYELKRIADRAGAQLALDLRQVANNITKWIEDTRASRQLFTDIAEPENREKRHRLRARSVLEQVVSRLGPLMRGVPIDLSQLGADVRLPPGTFVEWSAVFQNVIANAVNATLDSDERRLAAMNRPHGASQSILIQDTGVGVDLENADELFEPFVGRLKLSPSKQGLRIGGSGLGLAIVRMIATNLGCRVSFVKPDTSYSSAFRLAWSEHS